jgi:hypothetical protein
LKQLAGAAAAGAIEKISAGSMAHVPVAATGCLSHYCISSKQCSWIFKYSELTTGQLRILGVFI